jgi:hypothetical protein
MCDARVDLLRPRNINLQEVKPNASNQRTSKTNLIYERPEVARDREG